MKHTQSENWLHKKIFSKRDVSNHKFEDKFQGKY